MGGGRGISIGICCCCAALAALWGGAAVAVGYLRGCGPDFAWKSLILRAEPSNPTEIQAKFQIQAKFLRNSL